MSSASEGPCCWSLLGGAGAPPLFLSERPIFMVVTIIGIGAIVLLLLGVAFAVGPARVEHPLPRLGHFSLFLAFLFLILSLPH
jgi:hypothetical protein